MIASNEFSHELQRIFSGDPVLNSVPLEEILRSIPTVDQLDEAPPGTVVLVRSDLDVPLKEGEILERSRIRAGAETIKYCVSRGWKVVIAGHLGRDPRASLTPVCRALGEELGLEIDLISDWVDETGPKLQESLPARVARGAPGSVFLLENTRKYRLETALWTATEEEFPKICGMMYSLAHDLRQRLSGIEINEAIAASNLDFSSSVLPLAMRRTALGFYIADELKNHIGGARQANLVVVSGAKFTKLADLEAILKRGVVKWVISAGAFAMPLKKAAARVAGKEFSMGRVETDPNDKMFVDSDVMELADRIVGRCRAGGVDLILPIDFVLDSGEISQHIPSDRVQLDIGPKTRELFAQTVSQYIERSRSSARAFTMFYNGAFGLFEDPRYEAGTREFARLLRLMTKAGIRTYVGGGEGRLALAKFGSVSDVTHAFTAGVTILKSMSDDHLYYLKAMYLQNIREQRKA